MFSPSSKLDAHSNAAVTENFFSQERIPGRAIQRQSQKQHWSGIDKD